MKIKLTLLLTLVMIRFGSVEAESDLEIASLGDFELESGEVIRDLRIGYRTLGSLNLERTNAVLFPTWFTGTTADLLPLVGPGLLVDSSRYFVILVDALGDGVSSSPSNSALQPRMKFPRFTIADMVRSKHRLLNEVLRIDHLKAVLGISMGGMQTFQWMVSYPDFMDKAIPIQGSPRLSSYDVFLWTAEIRAIQADPAWKDGDYESPPLEGLKTVAAIHSLALTTPAHVDTTAGRETREQRVERPPSDRLSSPSESGRPRLAVIRPESRC